MHAQEQNLSTLAICVIGRVTSSIPKRGTFTNGTSLHVLRLHEGLIRMSGDEDMSLFFAGEIADDRQRIAALESFILDANNYLNKIPELERRIETLTNILNADVSETTKKAMMLRNIVDDRKVLSRKQVQQIFDGCHHNVATKIMKKAAQLYGYTYAKNISGKLVLAST